MCMSVCLSVCRSPADVDDINQLPVFLSSIWFSRVLFLVRISFCIQSTKHSVSGIYIRSPRFPTTPECDLSHHHNHNHHRVSNRTDEFSPYYLPPPLPLSTPLSHWWLVNPGRHGRGCITFTFHRSGTSKNRLDRPRRHPSRSLRGQ